MVTSVLNTALDCLQLDKFLEAERILKQIIKKNPFNHKAIYYLGWINERLNKKVAAKTYYSQAVLLNSEFYDIDEKLYGYDGYYLNENNELFNIINWMIKSKRTEKIPKIIAEVNKTLALKLLEEKTTVCRARKSLYNISIREIAKPYCDSLTMLIFELGMTLEHWGFTHPWDYPKAFLYLNQVSEAILNTKKFKNELLSKGDYNYIELEIIQRLEIKEAVPILLKKLDVKNSNVETIITTLGILGDDRAVFPLANFMKKANIEIIYPLILAISRLNNKAVIPLIRKVMKKYENTELYPLLFVSFCRLDSGKDALIELSRSKNVYIREEAINQLADYRGKDVVRVLLKALFDKDKISDFYPVRFTAFEKLEEMGIEYLSTLDQSFSYSKNMKEVEKVFYHDNVKIEWIENLLTKW